MILAGDGRPALLRREPLLVRGGLLVVILAGDGRPALPEDSRQESDAVGVVILAGDGRPALRRRSR